LKLVYFASVRQRLGKAEETVALPAEIATLGALVAHLATRGPDYAAVFGNPSALRAAVNQTHAQFGALIAADDEIAFFPPMTGG
jgi:sulfur-carrier protein